MGKIQIITNSPYGDFSQDNFVPFSMQNSMYRPNYNGNEAIYVPFKINGIIPPLCPTTYWTDWLKTNASEQTRTQGGQMPSIDDIGKFFVNRIWCSYDLLDIVQYRQIMDLIEPLDNPRKSEFEIEYYDIRQDRVITNAFYLYAKQEEENPIWVGGKMKGIRSIKFHFVGTNNKYFWLNVGNSDPEKGIVSDSTIKVAGVNTTVSASPNTDFTFKHWIDIKGEIQSTDNDYTFIMPYNEYDIIAVWN